jgi:hypothetical protein
MRLALPWLACLLVAGCVAQEEPSSDRIPVGGPGLAEARAAGCEEGYQVYEHDRFGFRFCTPIGWPLVEDSLNTLVYVHAPTSSSDFQPNMNVVHETLPEPMTLEEYARFSVETAPQYIPDILILESHAAPGDADAWILEYTGTLSGIRLHWDSVVRVEDDEAFMFTYTREPGSVEHAAEWETMARSFRFT